MPTKKTELIVRRNTAITSQKIVDQSCWSMMASDVPEGAYLFGFDPNTPEGESMLFAAETGKSRDASQHFSEPFLLHAWCVKRIALSQDEGDTTVPALRVCLIDTEGETLSFVSSGIVQSLDTIRTLRGDGPYDPPIPVVVVSVRTRHGFNVYKLRPVFSKPEAPKGK